MMLAERLKIYKGKKVLVTGHTGFKGAWLCIWLLEIGADVVGLALDPKSNKDLFETSKLSSKIKDYRGDIRDISTIKNVLEKEKPEVVFHLAAQPLVLDSYADPLYTYEVNVLGTAYLLDAIREANSVKVCICITTDKVYKNNEWVWPYRETEALGGYDPYSASKAAAELVINSYRSSFFNPDQYTSHTKSIASVRAGNVIGGGDWSENRIIPDTIKALKSGATIELRKPSAVRPWQHVIEPLGGYLLLGSLMISHPTLYCDAYNFGPESENIHTVQALVEELINQSQVGEWKDISDPNDLHEATLLSLDINKAKTDLKWHPVLSFKQTVAYTYEWYNQTETTDNYALSVKQIEDYINQWK